jgi:1-acyl-sn-glycerol-3-phosphate acyltransferase
MSLHRREPKLRLVRWPTQDWYNTPTGYRFIKAFFGGPVRFAARIQFKGVENIPKTGPVIVAPNHLTWADPIVLGVALHRPAFYLAKEGVFKNKAMAWFMETMGQIKVERAHGANDPAIDKAVELLDQGLVVGVFPEGTRSRGTTVRRGKTGVARIAAKSGAPIVPVALHTYDLWPREAPLPRLGRVPTYVNVGKPLRYDLKPADAEDRDKMREVTDDVLDHVRALLAECQRARDAHERWS